MLNQVVLVGRITENPKLEQIEDISGARITLAIPRSYKNSEGVYDTDFIPVQLWNGVAENTCKYCKKGDIVGVKGRLEFKDNQIIVVAEKLSFLSSKKENN